MNNYLERIFKQVAIDIAKEKLQKTKMVTYGDKFVLCDLKWDFLCVDSYPNDVDGCFDVWFLETSSPDKPEEISKILVSFKEVFKEVCKQVI